MGCGKFTYKANIHAGTQSRQQWIVDHIQQHCKSVHIGRCIYHMHPKPCNQQLRNEYTQKANCTLCTILQSRLLAILRKANSTPRRREVMKHQVTGRSGKMKFHPSVPCRSFRLPPSHTPRSMKAIFGKVQIISDRFVEKQEKKKNIGPKLANMDLWRANTCMHPCGHIRSQNGPGAFLNSII